jgi:hypothetical protein
VMIFERISHDNWSHSHSKLQVIPSMFYKNVRDDRYLTWVAWR